MGMIELNGAHISTSEGTETPSPTPVGVIAMQQLQPENQTTVFLPFLRTDAQRKGFGFFIFFVAGLAEIGGGWLVWQTIREARQWWMALLGSILLVMYGFIATTQPMDNFGRVYAIYGAFFIIMSLLWGFLVDGFRPDKGDLIGGGIVVVGALIMFLWPNR